MQKREKDARERILTDKLDQYGKQAGRGQSGRASAEEIECLLEKIRRCSREEIPSRDEAWERFLRIAARGKELLPLENAVPLALFTGDTEGGIPFSPEVGSLEGTAALVPGNGETERAAGPEPEYGEAERAAGLEPEYQEAERAVRPESSEVLAPDCGRTAEAALSEENSAVREEEKRDRHAFPGREAGETDVLSLVPPKSARAGNGAPGSAGRRGKRRRLAAFGLRHRVSAAVLFAAVVLALGSGVRSAAVQGTDFFFWLKQDETGRQMMTSPEGLDRATEKEEYRYFDRDELPEWAQGWLQIADAFEVPENYEWMYYEASELKNMQFSASNYLDQETDRMIALGEWRYFDKVSYNRDGYADYNYVNSFGSEQELMDVYSKTDEVGEVFYVICFYQGNSKYFLRGQEDLEDLKVLAEQYRNCIEKNKYFL